MSNGNEVRMEIAGPLAMFTRPDTGGTPTSYPVPTWSAAKAIFESIAFFKDGRAWICPVKVEVCRRVNEPGGQLRFQRYTTNYGGPLRKGSLFGTGVAQGGSSMQLFATVLSDVCYRLHGLVQGVRPANGTNPRHHLEEVFTRRLSQGQCFRTPCLGWSEFTCSYWGPFRESLIEVDTALSLEVPSMLFGVWDSPQHGEYEPAYVHNARVEAGVLRYERPRRWRQEKDRNGATDAQ